jgi:hypothetical protein
MAISKQTGIIAGGAGVVAAASLAAFMFLSSSVIHVAPGEDLQAAINSAPCESTIEVDAGQLYNANLTLPKKDCTGYTTIQSTRASELPEGVRIDPATQAPLLATLQSTVNAEQVIKTALTAHHYKLIGLHIKTQSESVFVYDLIRFGGGRDVQTSPDLTAHHLILDRSWVEGNGNQETQRGVTLNCADCGVTNSVVNNIKAKGMDTQAVCGWNGTLRAYITNNYLEAGAEIVMMGGSDPAQESMIPRLVEVRRNMIRRPLEWKGQGYTIKNLVEAKNVIGFTIDGNVMENSWAGEGQGGPCLLATVRNQDGTAPYSTIQNYVVTNNLVKNCDGVFNFLGSDNEKPSQRGSGALIANNVFDKINGPFITMNGFLSVTFEYNTDLQSCCNTMTLYGEQSANFIYRNNVNDEKQYGLFGDGGTGGQAALDKYAPGAVVTGNVIAHPYSPWPSGNTTVDALMITSDYRVPYANAGADIDKLLAAQAGNGPSQPSPTATASVTVSPSPLPSASPSATVPGGIPSGSSVGIVSRANVREKPSQSSKELFIAEVTDQGVTTGACEQDATSVNIYCPVTFSTRLGSGFVAMQFLHVLSATPTPTVAPTSTPTPATPTPTATPVPPTPTPTPRPSPSTTPLPFCASGQRPGSPPTCRCRNGFLGNSGKCR